MILALNIDKTQGRTGVEQQMPGQNRDTDARVDDHQHRVCPGGLTDDPGREAVLGAHRQDVVIALW
ncbi:hypothetical protein EDM58_11015 [Brevibacillus panacihumi]|uniref:Uncharacterized protein n=1 Tax=Brevibacillus panacihumi TaxID=497735 RepID=A0A3M8CUW1_9BACL|nr:hypothetical protein EDM58_11015 [Brevibacillus panacihumi]